MPWLSFEGQGRLTRYCGQPIVYDAVGNPPSYYNGRRLRFAETDGYRLSFAYNDEGIRTSKTVNGVEHVYRLNGDLIISEEWGKHLVLYLYDVDGSPVGMQYRHANYVAGDFDTYWFEKNLQGDIVAVYAENSTKLISYTYDAWGNFITTYHSGSTSTSTANYNPFRYRGYYYDTELGMYYLQSRYYDPVIGRFLSADNFGLVKTSPFSLYDKNFFAYCDNNPIMRRDSGGAFWDTIFDVVSLVLSVIDVISDPTDTGAWVGLAGDVVDLIPFVTCVGETTRAIRIVNKAVDRFGGLSKAKEYGIRAYNALKKALKGTGLEAHHIIEQRLVKHLGIDVNTMLSVAVTKAEHQQFTNAWRKWFKYGTNYKDISISDIWKAAQDIYKDYPELLKAAKKILFGKG